MGILKVEQGAFIQVVATLDLGSDQAEILYVNPATSASLTDDGDGDPQATLELLSATGAVLEAVHPALHTSSCRGDGADQLAMIQEYLPAHPEAATVRLKVGDKIVAEFSPGAAPAHQPPSMGAEAVDTASRNAGPKLALGRGNGPAAHVTYSIQARSTNARTWDTLAVGRQTPEVVIDANQFPGQRQVEVRVLETNGFIDNEVARQVYELKK